MADITSRWSALVASGRAAWRRGMVTQRGNVVLTNKSDGQHAVFLRGSPLDEVRADAVPDWSNGPTRGALLDQVRERWGDPGACPVYQSAWDTEPARWCVAGLAHGGWRGEFAASEAEALLAALEAAPEGA